MVQLFPNDPNKLVTLINMRTPLDGSIAQEHSLFIKELVFDENFTLPAGSVSYISPPVGAVEAGNLPADVLVGAPRGAQTRDTLFQALGSHIGISSYMGAVEGGVMLISGIDPETGLEVGAQIGFQQAADAINAWGYSWPWQQ